MLTFSMVAVAVVSVSAETSDDSASGSPYLTVNATSNLFGDAVTEYNEGTNQVTVTYTLNADIPLINFEVDFTYDSNVLSVDKSVKGSTWSPLLGSAAVFNKSVPGLISANASSLSGYESNGVFAKLVFNVNEGLTAPITTTVDANVKVMSFGEVDEDTEMLINDTHKYLVQGSVVDEDYAKEIDFTTSAVITPESDFVPSTEPTTTVASTTVEPTTVASTTVEPTTVAPTTDAQDTTTVSSTPYLTVNATSNLFGTTTGVYDAETNQVVVTYNFDSDLPVINFETTITYDPTVLSLDSSVKASTWSPNLKVSGQVFNKDLYGQIKINASSLSGYEFGGTFARLVFNVNDISAIAPTTTTVDLDMAVMSFGEIDEDTEQLIEGTDVYIVKSHTVNQEVADAVNFASYTESTPDTFVQDSTTVEPTTVEPTTVEPTTVEPTTVEPTTVAPTTAEPTTVAPTTVAQDTTTAPSAPYLTVNATSNLFGTATGVYDAETNQVVVTYYFDADLPVINFETTISYDPEVLSVDKSVKASTWSPNLKVSGQVFNKDLDGQIKINASSLSGYEFGGTFAQIVFDVNDISAIAPTTTTVNLDMTVMSFGEIDEDTEMLINGTDVYIAKSHTVDQEVADAVNFTSYTELTPDTFVQDATTEPATTVAPTTVAPTTAEPTTVAPTTVEPTTVASGLDITATSNLFPANNYKAEVGETVSVAYILDSDKAVLNTAWVLNYDPSVLELVDSNDFMPQMSNAVLYNTENAGVVEGSASDLNLYSVTADQPFVVVTFNVIGEGDTTVDLYVKTLTVSERDENGMNIEGKETSIVKNGVVETTEGYTVDTVFNFVPTPTEAPTTVEPTTVEPTTVEPTTVEPTTVEPTTVAPTEPTDVTYKYYIAGTENLFVTNWDGTGASNEMTLGEDGIYSLVITAEDAPLDAQFKVVKIGDDGTTEWIGPAIGNYAFTVTDVCDVTITYNPVTGEVTYSGDYVNETILNIDNIYAVGNGDGNWLNDAAWDPAADENKMTEVSYGVYTITYTDIDADDNYQVKFAANGTWADSWGGVYTESGVAAEAVYNGENIIVEVPEDGSTVTLTLDLSTFDYASKTGAKFIITVTEGQEPTTVEPTTVAPTTVAPTTVAPTEAPTTVAPTEAPTTVAPTEAPTTVATTEPTDVTYKYYIAGTENLFVTNWDGTGASNEMTLGEDGVYSLVITAEDTPLDAQFKVVKIGDDGTTEWIGPEIGNYAFTVTNPCDVTITYNPVTGEVTYSGEFVTETVLNIEAIYAVGNGDGNWLNDAAWDPAADENKMTQVSDGVYTITYTDIDADDNYQVKFAANGTWADSWGGVYTESGVAADAVYNGDNIIVEVPEDGSTVTLTLDLTAFDYASKTGAKFTITVTEGQEPTTVAPTTVAPTEAPTTAAPTEAPTTAAPTEAPTTAAPTEAPTTAAPTEAPTTVAPTEAPTTVAPTEAPTTVAPTTVAPTTVEPTTVASGLDITATSNLFPVNNYKAEVGETVTVAYVLDSDKAVLNTTWVLNYDPSVLELVDSNDFMPQMSNATLYNTQNAGVVEGSASDLNLYDVTADQPFVVATFNVIGEGDTTVDLYVKVLTVSERDENGMDIEDEETYIVKKGVVETTEGYTADTVFNFVPAPTEAPTTEAPTTVAPTTVEPTTVAPTTVEPTTVAPTTVEPTTVAPTTVEPTTVAPTTVEPTTEAPEETTVAPTEAPATDAPVIEVPTDATATEPTTVIAPTTSIDAQSSTAAPTTTKSASTSDTANKTTTTSTGSVQTGEASMAIIILSILVVATGVMFVLRKKELF
jgi:hypothetical protein